MSNLSAPKKTVHELFVPSDAALPPCPKQTVYETSSGGVVLRHIRGAWQVAIIEPNIINADTITRRAKARPEGTVFALPKGGVDEGETPEQSAVREVFEETGVHGRCLFRLTTIRYLYVRSWGGREHVSKVVSFYLFLYTSGRLGQIRADMRDEVRKAFWFPLDKAHRKLTYRGEREVLKMAQKIVREHPERLTPPASVQSSTAPSAPRPTAQQRGTVPPRGNSQPRNPSPQRGPSPQRNTSQPRNTSQQRNTSQPRGQSQSRNAPRNPSPGNTPQRGVERPASGRAPAPDTSRTASGPVRSFHKES